MALTKELVCISCPMGCHLKVTVNGEDIQVEGNSCKNGITYGIEEVTNPKRIIPTTVVLENGKLPRLPVKTSTAVPKELIFDIMNEINKIKVLAPVKMGDVIIPNILNTGADIIATRSIDSI